MVVPSAAVRSLLILLKGAIAANNPDVKCHSGIRHETVCPDYCPECGPDKAIVIHSPCDDGGTNATNKGHNFDRETR